MNHHARRLRFDSHDSCRPVFRSTLHFLNIRATVLYRLDFFVKLPTVSLALLISLTAIVSAQSLQIAGPNSLPTGEVGIQYSSGTYTATGGTPPYTWTWSGTLAEGLTLSQTMGPTTSITGSPVDAGNFGLEMGVVDSVGNKAYTSYPEPALIIVPAVSITAINLGPGFLPWTGEVGVPYGPTTYSATPGLGPYSWSLVGSLPPGLSLSAAFGSTTILTGTPTATTGCYTFQVQVRDSLGGVFETSYPRSSLCVALALSIQCSVAAGTVGVAYSGASCSASGGTPPYTFSAGGLPPGLRIDSSTGAFAGTPTTAGSYSVTAVVIDSTSTRQTANQTFTITINPPLSIQCSSAAGTVGVAYSGASCSASGGTSPYTFSAGGLPPGLSMNASTGAITGTPNTAGSYSVAATVTDSAAPTKQTDSQQFTITITTPQQVTLSQISGNSLPNQVELSLTFAQAAPNDEGTLSLSFAADPSVTNIPADYVDPSAGFPVSGSNDTALTTSFTVPASTATQASVQFAEGTVAGTWTVTMTALKDADGTPVLPNPAPTITVSVQPAAPVIEVGTVQITGVTSNGFAVKLNGYSTTRSVSSATFQFTPASGASLQGTTVTVPFNGADQSQWFGTSASLPYGGNFFLSVPFAFSGNTSALGSVTVTLSNAVGTSVAVSSSQ